MFAASLAPALALALLASADAAPALCAPAAQLLELADCPDLGPGAYRAQYAAAALPPVLPDLPLADLPRPAKALSETYARVVTPDAPLFTTPEDAAAGLAVRTLGRGFVFVQLVEAATAGDLPLYRVHSGEYIRAADLELVEPTSFQGVQFTERPAGSFGWLVATVRPSPAPGVPAPKEVRRLARYRVVQIFGTVRVGAWNWYLIGPGQWVEQRAVSVVTFHPPPAGVSGDWVQVNLYEQNLVAYEGDQPVYATLVSSGLDKWATEPGLFQVYARLRADRMRGAYAPDKSDYYYLEAVPYVLYFDGDRALHGEYWHDRLGFKRSHGCVNLAPLDARWLYNWAGLGTQVWVFDPSQAGGANAEAAAIGP
ncbi:MAG: L,D-transpeptidase [Anaerolineales bacterium]|nr:L,D-transpeptidase [Anaerolineales bacterium]